MEEAAPESVEAQQRILEAASRRSSLTRLLTPVAAYSLGAIPVARDEDGLALATFPGICAGAVETLRRVLGVPLKLLPFDENVITFFLDKIYLKGRGINIQTFSTPDFLGTPACDAKLLTVKVETPEGSGVGIGPDEIVLADLHLRSELHNLDRPQPARLDSYRLGEFCPAFRRQNGEWLVWSGEPLPDDVPLLLQLSEDYGGEEFYKDLSAFGIREFPHVVFPSEVQLLGLAPRGALHVYVDGASRWVEPGSTVALEAEYWLLRHGWRFHRKIAVQVRGLAVAKRSSLRREPQFRGAGAEELRKWLSL
jgi:hypothetical protein